MKKVLFSAAALSCSCLFASAFTTETAIGWVSLDNGELSTSDGFTLSQEDSTIGYALSLDSGNWVSNSTSARDELTFAVTIDFSKIEFDAADMCFFYLDGSRGDVGIGWNVETQCVTTTWNTDYDIHISQLSASGVVTFAFTMGHNGARIYQNSGTGYWSSGTVKGDLGTISKLVVTSDAASAIDNLVVWNKDIAFTGGNASVASALQASTSLIPEPSAFGLLAGAGALALVASRRRRSR